MSEVPLYAHLQLRKTAGSYFSQAILPQGIRREVVLPEESHMETFIFHKLGFYQNYYTFTLMLVVNIVLCSKFP